VALEWRSRSQAAPAGLVARANRDEPSGVRFSSAGTPSAYETVSRKKAANSVFFQITLTLIAASAEFQSSQKTRTGLFWGLERLLMASRQATINGFSQVSRLCGVRKHSPSVCQESTEVPPVSVNVRDIFESENLLTLEQLHQLEAAAGSSQLPDLRLAAGEAVRKADAGDKSEPVLALRGCWFVFAVPSGSGRPYSLRGDSRWCGHVCARPVSAIA
jgi:hypothetical protein